MHITVNPMPPSLKLAAIAVSGFLFTMASPMVRAGTFYVDDASGDDSAEGTSEAPLKTIAAGVAKAAASSEPRKVVVKTGTYRINSFIAISNAVSVVSETGKPADVIVDGQGLTHVFQWTDWASNSSRLEGLTVQNGFIGTGNVADGLALTAGVYMRGGIITNCVIRHCVVSGGGTVSAVGAGVRTDANRTYSIVPRILDSHIYGNVVSNYCGSKSTNVRGGGILLGDSGGGVIKKCVVEDNVAWIYANVSEYSGLNIDTNLGGGIYGGRQTEIYDCIVRNNRSTNAFTKGWAGGGGGIAVDANSVISNCLVYGNMSSCCGGGIATVGSNSLITHCTITNNTICAVANNASFVGGSGVALRGSYSKCFNSRIDRNAILGATGQTKSGGAVIISGSRCLVANCSVSDNSAHTGGAFFAGSVLSGSGQDAVVSNCFISGNTASVNAAVLAYWIPQNVLVTDCVVVSNSAPDRPICYGYSAGKSCGGIRFRNSFFTRNSLSTTSGYGDGLFGGQLTQTYKQPLIIDHCTIVSNDTKYRVIYPGSDEISNHFCYASVFFGNRNLLNNTRASIYLTSIASTTNAWYNFADGSLNMSSDSKYGNFTTLTKSSFVNQAAGDYRFVRGSIAQDMGGPVQEWMQGKGALDMGDGTMTVKDGPGYGIEIVRNNALRRLKNLPEPGCFELWWPIGASLNFR